MCLGVFFSKTFFPLCASGVSMALLVFLSTFLFDLLYFRFLLLLLSYLLNTKGCIKSYLVLSWTIADQVISTTEVGLLIILGLLEVQDPCGCRTSFLCSLSPGPLTRWLLLLCISSAFVCTCLCVCSSFLLTNTLVEGCTIHSNGLMLVCEHFFQSSVSKLSHILRYWGSVPT